MSSTLKKNAFIVVTKSRLAHLLITCRACPSCMRDEAVEKVCRPITLEAG